MSDITYITLDDDLAAVKYQGKWRFFYGQEGMFFLDYTKYEPNYQPKPNGYRWGTMIVDEHNAFAWMNQLTEIAASRLLQLAYRGYQPPLPLRFVIDFDQRIWVGYQWQFDQSALTDYQPDGWTAKEDQVLNYLAPELRRYWQGGA